MRAAEAAVPAPYRRHGMLVDMATLSAHDEAEPRTVAHRDDDAGPRAPRTRMSGSQRRAQLIAVARAEFAERGFEGPSVEQIAARADDSKPELYEHFAGTDDLKSVV